MAFRASIFVSLILLFAASGAAHAADTTAASLMEQANLATYYAGDGAQARISIMLMNKFGAIDERKFWLVRRDIKDLGDQRYFIYFTEPDSVARTTFMIHKKVKKKNNRWQYLPATDRVLRVPADNRQAPFAGTDLNYEDLTGRWPALDEHEILGPDSTLRRAAIKVKSTPRDSSTADYSYRISWIGKESKLPLKTEYFSRGDTLLRSVEVGRIEVIDKIPTAKIIKITDLRIPRWTTVSILEMTYQTKLEPKDFKQKLLKNPPVEFTK